MRQTFRLLSVRAMRALAALLALVFALVALFGCAKGGGEEEEDGEGGRTGLTLLKTDGELIRDGGGTGEEVLLRGVNAGGLFVIEQWMTAFTNSTDHKTTARIMAERFGQETAAEMWETYRQCWWGEADFENCAEMGINVIRLPFTYMNVDYDAVFSYDDAGQDYDFSALDTFIAQAAEYGMYTILDLHGAYGSQNGQDHSGEVVAAEDIDFYENEQMQALTVSLWRALAEHYRDNPNVAAYDILNEPAEKTSSGTQTTAERHWEFMDDVYEAIREEDEDHIVVFESCWDGENLPHPSVYGWENCMYSFHHYSGSSDYGTHAESVNDKIAGVTRQGFGVPLQLGEFSCYTNEESWEYTLGCLNRSGWHWTSWTYKVNNSWGNSGWGIVYTDAESVDVNTDSYETILSKWEGIKTDSDTPLCTFSSGGTLFEIIREYAAENEETAAMKAAELSDGEYAFYVSGTENTALAVGGKIGSYSRLRAVVGMSDPIAVSNHPDGDGSVNLLCSDETLAVYDYGGGSYVALMGSSDTDARFYPLETEDGDLVFLSYVTGRYLRYDDDADAVMADGTGLDSALHVTLF